VRTRSRLHPVRSLVAVGAGALLLAGCSSESVVERGLSQMEGVDDVEIDSDGGSISIRGEDGESIDIEVDEDEGTSTITTEEGTVTTGQSSEIPPEIAAVFTPPAGFEPQAVSDLTDDGRRGLMVQGPITGDWGELMDEIEASVEAGPWDEVERQAMVVGAMGSVIGTQESDAGSLLTVSLIMDEDETEGLLSIMLLLPAE
jgi:hypothetical protein